MEIRRRFELVIESAFLLTWVAGRSSFTDLPPESLPESAGIIFRRGSPSKGRILSIVKKIPKLEQIAPVYAVIVMLVYPWTIIRYFWKLSSWALFTSLGDLANYFAYMMALNFLESIIILLAPLLLNMILPPKWFYDRFVTRGVSLVLLGLGYLILLNRNMNALDPFPWDMIRLIPIVAVVILILVFLIDRIPFVPRILDELSNRALVFLYVSIPISVISVLVVLIRNIY